MLARTIGELAAVGPKHAGTDGAARAAEMLRAQMSATGADVKVETFAFPRHDVRSSQLGASIGKSSLKTIEHDVLDG